MPVASASCITPGYLPYFCTQFLHGSNFIGHRMIRSENDHRYTAQAACQGNSLAMVACRSSHQASLTFPFLQAQHFIQRSTCLK